MYCKHGYFRWGKISQKMLILSVCCRGLMKDPTFIIDSAKDPDVPKVFNIIDSAKDPDVPKVFNIIYFAKDPDVPKVFNIIDSAKRRLFGLSQICLI